MAVHHECNQSCCLHAQNGSGPRFKKIDIHTHIIPKTWPNWNEKFGYSGWLHIHHDPTSPVPITDTVMVVFTVFADKSHPH